VNVVVLIQGREAVPVRAIPFLTDWRELQPETIARLLSDDEEVYRPHKLLALRIDALGNLVEVPPRWWGEKRREIKAISEEIKAVQPGHESGRQRWRRDATRALPLGAFVWKADLEDFVARIVQMEKRGASRRCLLG